MKKWVIWGVSGAVLVLILLIVGLYYYTRCFAQNVRVNDASSKQYLYIREGEHLDDVIVHLGEMGVLTNEESFEWCAYFMEYDKMVKPGKYLLINGESNYHFIGRLRLGKQVPVNVTFINVRSVNDLAGVVSRKIDVDSASLVTLLNDTKVLDSLGYNRKTILSLFIPNTYQFMWATSCKKFLQRMASEHSAFWSNERVEKARQINLKPVEVSTLASIVDEETNKNDEKPVIAGLYMNRLKKGIPLQADPTIKFALNDFARKRILLKDLEVESPYNTYKHTGLPPGPIRIASIQGIDAVLNYSRHDYIFMCAKEDLSGYHNFTRSLAQHNENARRYQAAIQRLGIKK